MTDPGTVEPSWWYDHTTGFHLTLDVSPGRHISDQVAALLRHAADRIEGGAGGDAGHTLRDLDTLEPVGHFQWHVTQATGPSADAFRADLAQRIPDLQAKLAARRNPAP